MTLDKVISDITCKLSYYEDLLDSQKQKAADYLYHDDITSLSRICKTMEKITCRAKGLQEALDKITFYTNNRTDNYYDILYKQTLLADINDKLDKYNKELSDNTSNCITLVRLSGKILALEEMMKDIEGE